MPTTDLLKQFGLTRNPFTDRTAEKTSLDAVSLYIHSDLRGFNPSETTYVFFGKRGSGKTTIRLQMEEAYRKYNEEVQASGRSKGHFIVDLTKPGHMTACLTTFRETIEAGDENWDATFSQHWKTADLVDCILSYAATELMRKLSAPGPEKDEMLAKLRSDPKHCRQFLLLAHLYSRVDIKALQDLRAALMRSWLQPKAIATSPVTGVAVATAAGVAVARHPKVSELASEHLDAAWERVADNVPLVRNHSRLLLAAGGCLAAAGGVYYMRWRKRRSVERATELQSAVRVVKAQPLDMVASLVDRYFTLKDTVDTIRTLCIGISAHQKLELLASLVRTLGYESLAVFGDCFDEVTLLDPVRYPEAIKVFAREVCRNDVLNFGRLHFFFPDSRIALNLNTDKTLKEARFDRHFVRDLTWSRHQLEELAERRFRAAQKAGHADSKDMHSGMLDPSKSSFADLFKQVRGEDFSSYISKLTTPRELMIMMTEMFARIEANPEGGLTAQDMEIAVSKALEQSV